MTNLRGNDGTVLFKSGRQLDTVMLWIMHCWRDNSSSDTLVISCVVMIWVVWTSRCWHNNHCGRSVLAPASVHCTLYSAIRASHQLTADNKGPAAGGIFSFLRLCRRKFGYMCHPSNQPLAIHVRGVNWNWKERSLYRYWMKVVCVCVCDELLP
jgi:hypothetical protein